MRTKCVRHWIAWDPYYPWIYSSGKFDATLFSTIEPCSSSLSLSLPYSHKTKRINQQNKNVFYYRQELDRMQKVLKEVQESLCDLKLAIDGTIVMSPSLRASLDAMYDARIPDRWMKVKLRNIVPVTTINTANHFFNSDLLISIQFNNWYANCVRRFCFIFFFFSFLTSLLHLTPQPNTWIFYQLA